MKFEVAELIHYRIIAFSAADTLLSKKTVCMVFNPADRNKIVA